MKLLMSKATKYIIIYLVTIVIVCAYSAIGYYFNKNNEPLWHVNSDQQALMRKSLDDANTAANAYLINSINSR